MNIPRLFSIKEPCKECPFRKGNNDMLTSGRLEGIIRKLHDNHPFHCHKTIDYTRLTNDEQIADARYCAGSMIYLKKVGNTNLPMRLGQMIGAFDPDELRGDEEVIDSLGLDSYVFRSTPRNSNPFALREEENQHEAE